MSDFDQVTATLFNHRSMPLDIVLMSIDFADEHEILLA
jgi:hypothetical protein